LGVQDEKGDTPEMVAVQVREQDALDLRGLNTEALHRHERRGPAIDKKLGGLSL
jgi:hypothetical protein